MQPIGELLFTEQDPDLAHFLAWRAEISVRNALEGAAEPTRLCDRAAAAALIAKLRCEPLRLDLARSVTRVEDIKLARGEPRAKGAARAVLTSRVIPFSGDARLWRLRPAQFNDHPPRGDVTRDSLVIGVVVALSRCARARDAIEDALLDVRRYLAWQEAEIEAHNAGLAEFFAERAGAARVSA